MTITKEGALASFYTVNKVPIKHLKVYFSPKQAGTGDPSPENVREISGWNEINLQHTSINIWDEQTEPGSISIANGANSNTGINSQIRTKNYIPVIGGTEYIAITEGTSASKYGFWMLFYDKNKNLITTGLPNGSSSAQNGRRFNNGTKIQMPDNCAYVRWYFQTSYGIKYKNDSGLNYPSTDTSYYFYRGHTYNLDWSNNIGTIYGGYVDLITGELVKTHNLIHYDGTENWEIKTSTNNPINSPYTARIYVSDGFRDGVHYSTVYSNKLKPEKNYYTQLYGVSLSYTSVFNVGTPSQVSDISSFRTWMNDIQGIDIIYPLQNPITYQLTPTQLQTFIGQNNIWSNADRVEVEYDLAESNDELYRRRNIILSGYPHIATASGAMANFTTDMAAPLREYKVNFLPVQEGSGDPSPSNVRNINGWNSVDIIHTGINIWDEEWENGYYNADGDPVNSSSFWRNKNLIPVTPGTKYAFIGKAKSTLGFRRYDQNKNYLGMSIAKSVDTTYGCEITINDDTYYIKFFANDESAKTTNISINYPATDTIYHAYCGRTIPITFPNNQTIYGGYVDLINGELVETYKKYNVQDLEAVTYGASSYDGTLGTNVMYYLNRRTNTGVGYPSGPMPYGDKIKVAPKNISGYYTGTWSNPNDYIWQFCINASNQLHVVFDNTTVGITQDMTFAQKRATVTAWIQNNPISVVVPLETPIHHPLTPQTLKTLKGVNNIWSNANGPISIQYWTH